MRLLLLYMEAIKDPRTLAAAAEAARSRDLPIVALKAGRTASGQRAATSHTGALASEDRVVDAFFERHGIWRAADPHELVAAAALYASGRRPRGKRLVFISNSGASCVMAADFSEQQGIPLAQISPDAKAKLAHVLPAFAALQNPIDVTGALLGNPELFGAVLPIVGEDRQSELLLVGMPVAGTGYDVARFARDLATFSSNYPHAVALACPQQTVRDEFAKAGVATFAREPEAMKALAQLADHAALLRKSAPKIGTDPISREMGSVPIFLNEAESLAMLGQAGIAVIEHRLCRTEEEVLETCANFQGAAVLKACSPDIPHKSDQGLVALEPQDPTAEFRRQRERCRILGARFDGVIVARRAARGRELALGARMDAQFGPVVLVGDGGIYLEALKDFRLLLPPFDEQAVLEKLQQLRVAPLLRALRGQPARDVQAFARMAVALGDAMLAWQGKVATVDINPVMLFEAGQGAVALDALIIAP